MVTIKRLAMQTERKACNKLQITTKPKTSDRNIKTNVAQANLLTSETPKVLQPKVTEYGFMFASDKRADTGNIETEESEHVAVPYNFPSRVGCLSNYNI